jgi:polyhydroxybutyrate depolymerase
MRSTNARCLAALVTALVVVAACSSGDDSTSSDTSSGADETSTSTTAVGDGEPSPSAGCGAQDDALVTTTDGTMTSGDTERTFGLGVPTSNDGMTPMPLVVDIHGLAEGAAIHRTTSAMGLLGEAEGFTTVFPQALGDVPAWSVNRDDIDTRYVNDLVDLLEAGLCLDTTRLYLTGFSMGGMMTSLLSCTDADRFAAAAPVAGTVPIADCDPARPVPVLAFHGTDDNLVAFDGGLAGAESELTGILPEGALDDVNEDSMGAIDPAVLDDDAPSIVEVIGAWAKRNGCADTYTEESAGKSVRLLTWDDCPATSPADLYVVDGGGHAWPGSDFSASIEAVVGFTTFEIVATDLIWEFFQQFHR